MSADRFEAIWTELDDLTSRLPRDATYEQLEAHGTVTRELLIGYVNEGVIGPAECRTLVERWGRAMRVQFGVVPTAVGLTLHASESAKSVPWSSQASPDSSP